MKEFENRDLDHFELTRGDFLVIEVKAQENKVGSIIVPESKKEPFIYGKVVKAGPPMLNMTGGESPPFAEIDEVVLHGPKAGFMIYLDGVEYRVIEQDKIVAKFRK